MRVFDAKYATIDLLKEKKSIQITWKSIVNLSQYKLVAELIVQLLRKNQINAILEDQATFQTANKKEIQQYFINSIMPRFGAFELESYYWFNSNNQLNADEIALAAQKYPIQFKAYQNEVIFA